MSISLADRHALASLFDKTFEVIEEELLHAFVNTFDGLIRGYFNYGHAIRQPWGPDSENRFQSCFEYAGSYSDPKTVHCEKNERTRKDKLNILQLPLGRQLTPVEIMCITKEAAPKVVEIAMEFLPRYTPTTLRTTIAEALLPLAQSEVEMTMPYFRRVDPAFFPGMPDSEHDLLVASVEKKRAGRDDKNKGRREQRAAGDERNGTDTASAKRRRAEAAAKAAGTSSDDIANTAAPKRGIEQVESRSSSSISPAEKQPAKKKQKKQAPVVPVAVAAPEATVAPATPVAPAAVAPAVQAAPVAPEAPLVPSISSGSDSGYYASPSSGASAPSLNLVATNNSPDGLALPGFGYKVFKAPAAAPKKTVAPKVPAAEPVAPELSVAIEKEAPLPVMDIDFDSSVLFGDEPAQSVAPPDCTQEVVDGFLAFGNSLDGMLDAALAPLPTKVKKDEPLPASPGLIVEDLSVDLATQVPGAPMQLVAPTGLPPSSPRKQMLRANFEQQKSAAQAQLGQVAMHGEVQPGVQFEQGQLNQGHFPPQFNGAQDGSAQFEVVGHDPAFNSAQWGPYESNQAQVGPPQPIQYHPAHNGFAQYGAYQAQHGYAQGPFHPAQVPRSAVRYSDAGMNYPAQYVQQQGIHAPMQPYHDASMHYHQQMQPDYDMYPNQF